MSKVITISALLLSLSTMQFSVFANTATEPVLPPCSEGASQS